MEEAAAPGDRARDGWARVIRVDYAACLVAGTADPVAVRTQQPVAVGDWVRVSPGDDPHVIAVAERSAQVTRRDAAGLLQVLAANVDIVFLTVPADRVNLARTEREVTIAWDSGAQPMVLLTKADLDDGTLAAELRQRLLGVDIIEVSAVRDGGLDEVRAVLADDRTAVLIGPSGAGKSTFVNGLLGQEVAATAAVREADHRGRHTTTSRQLHAIPTGGFIIDTPGLRSLSLSADAGAVASTFPEIAELAEDCRFRDCSHVHEPGCAVLAAAQDGTLDPHRLESYRRLMKDLAYHLRRDDPLAAQANEAIWRARRIEARRINRERGPR